jgi:hypothetical protein
MITKVEHYTNRHAREVMVIEKHNHMLNRDDRLKLSKTCRLVINILRTREGA